MKIFVFCWVCIFFITFSFGVRCYSEDIVIETLGVGDNPRGIAVNSATNFIYVANLNDDTVSVIDGATNSISTTFVVGGEPVAIVVNSVTNRIYVANNKDNTVDVIDGNINGLVATINTPGEFVDIAANDVTNLIYVVEGSGAGFVLNGETDSIVATFNGGNEPGGMCINSATNKIYVSNFADDTVTVIDGVTNTVVKTVAVGDGPLGLAVNPTSGFVYVANFADDTVSVIEGTEDVVVSTIDSGDGAINCAVNSATDFVYVTNSNEDTVTVINGASNSVIGSVDVGNGPLGVAVNSVTGFVYVANLFDDSVSVIQADFDVFVPIFTSISPLFGHISESVVVKIEGENFSDGMEVNISGDGVEVTDFSVESDLVASAMFTILPSAKAGVRKVSITKGTSISGTLDFVIGGGELVTVIKVGDGPLGIDVNTSTNRVYVCNSGDDSVSVIDGDTNDFVSTILVGDVPVAVAVNSTTNLIYVINRVGGVISVIDGVADSLVAAIGAGNDPSGLFVNPVTGFLYVANSDDDTVTVNDGTTNRLVAIISVGDEPFGLGGNSVTNRIYVGNRADNTVSVIDGVTNRVIGLINVDGKPGQIDVHTATNRVYVTHDEEDSVSVIDGTTNSIIEVVEVGKTPIGVAVNSTTNLVYVTHDGNDVVSVIDVNENSVVTETVGLGVVAVNPITNLIYMASFGGDYVVVVKDVVAAGFPLLSSIFPNSGLQGEEVDVVLNGKNFTEDMSVNISGTGVIVSNLEFGSSTSATALFSIASDATSFVRNVNIETGSGTSNSVPFNIETVLAPELLSLSVDSAFLGDVVDVVFTGNNFAEGLFIGVSGKEGINVHSINVTSSTSASAVFEVAIDAEPGRRGISVITPNGGESNKLDFFVTVLAPELISIEPASSVPDRVVNVVLTGNDFTRNISVSVSGDGINISDVVFISNISATAVFNISANATPGEREVRVINEEGVSNSLIFTISAKPTADFSMSRRFGKSPLTISFTDSSRGVISAWFWVFGDGTTSKERNPTHTYEVDDPLGVLKNIRNIEVILTVIGPGGVDTDEKKITVYAPRFSRR